MVTFIELLGFSKQRHILLPDDEFQAFQERLIEDPEAGDTIIGTGGFRKIGGAVLEWESVVVSE